MIPSQDSSTPFFVEKMEWEYGEKYGHVFYPKNFEEFKTKLDELDQQASKREYPFYVDVYFRNNTHVGIIVGSTESLLHFFEFYRYDDKGLPRSRLDGHYVESDKNYFVEYYYHSSLSNVESKHLLPKEKVLRAVFDYIETQKLPSYIKLTRQEFIDKYVQPET